MQNNIQNKYDIAVIGGGPIGLCMVFALLADSQTTGLKIILIERNENILDSFDSRALALNLASIKFFEKLGIANIIQKHSEIINAIRVSKNSSGDFFDLKKQNLTQCKFKQFKKEKIESTLSLAITANKLGAILLDAINNKQQKDNNLTILKSTSFESLKITKDFYNQINLVNKKNQKIKLCSKLVLAADGVNSKVRNYLGIYSYKKKYHGYLALATAMAKKSTPGLAYEHFGRNGPLALLPLLPKKQHANQKKMAFKLVYSITENAFAKYKELNLKQQRQYIFHNFNEEFNNYGQLQRDEIQLISLKDLVFYPTSQVKVSKLFHKQIIFLGNAAHGLHPVAAQGLNLGIRDLQKFIELVATHDFLSNPQKLNLNLQKYQNIRLKDYHRVNLFTNGLMQLYSENKADSNNLITIKKFGNLGIKLISKSKFLQHKIINFGSYG